jgi:hypothetical protein
LPEAKKGHNPPKMKLQVQIKMNEALFLRDPQGSELGKKIIKHSIQLIFKHGFEAFTFKKLAEDIGTTEAGIGVGWNIKLRSRRITLRIRLKD